MKLLVVFTVFMIIHIMALRPTEGLHAAMVRNIDKLEDMNSYLDCISDELEKSVNTLEFIYDTLQIDAVGTACETSPTCF